MGRGYGGFHFAVAIKSKAQDRRCLRV